MAKNATKKPAGASKITAADKAKAAQKIKTMQPAKPKGAVARGKAAGANTSLTKGVGGKSAAEKIVGAVGKRVKTTMREAGDVAKAVNNAANVGYRNARVNSGSPVKALAGDIAKQIKETGKAALTGKSGTKAATVVKDNTKAAKAWGGSKKIYVGAKTVPGKKR